jgi:ribulose kinase
MAVSDNPLFVNGIWGPYYSAMVPGLWLNEAGQSATGKLIDHIIYSHKASDGIKSKIGSKIHIIEYLNTLLAKMALKQGKDVDLLTNDIHVWPDFHGNRSPIADSSLRGMVKKKISKKS